MDKSTFQLGFDSICIRDHSKYAPQSHTIPIFATSTFVYESVEKAHAVFHGKEHSLMYSRWSHPNAELVEEKLAHLEVFSSNLKAKTFVFSSGMAAIAAAVNAFLKPQSSVLVQADVYGTSVELFNYLKENNRCNPIFINALDLDEIENQLQQNNTSLLYAETPNNPTLQCIDIQALADLCKKYNCKLIIDNTFCTAYIQQPLLLGADAVVYSTTKYLNGHGTALGGAVVSCDEAYMKKVWRERKVNGAMLSPFDAWLLNCGLKTLSLRLEKHAHNALMLATYLAQHPQVSKVNYPGLDNYSLAQTRDKQMRLSGGVLSFELKSGYDKAVDFLKKVAFCTLTASIGTPDTLVQHPASMTHFSVPKEQCDKFGITESLIRVSVGMENIEDIIADFKQALE